ncbi:MAG: phosphoribosylformimino-5-aminoimidazole carboxamide ribotide isomerase [Lachnospiraceae bacterium]
MELRPCIDLHNGKVKQIVGGTLKDLDDQAETNFVSEADAAYYARLYRSHGLRGGHVILLNGADSPYYEATKQEAFAALRAYPGGLQAGGGIHEQNAELFLEAGASHVIVTSYVFYGGEICYDRLEKLRSAVGKEHIVLDVSCRKREGRYDIVTDRWQKFTQTPLSVELLRELSAYCDEFLVHAVDVEGRTSGIEEPVVRLLAKAADPVTYAGGISSYDDIAKIKEIGNNRVNITIGSALSLFGGQLDFEEIIRCVQS